MNIKILKDKNFSLLMFGKITSLIGSSMQSFALSLFVLAVTGSATKFASILAVSMIPQLVLGPFAGVFVDWFHRKKLLVILDILSGTVVVSFALIYFITNELPLGYIYVLVILLSLISTLFQPTVQTVIPTIMKKENLADANAMNSLIMSLGQLAAPALAGVLYGIYGLKVIFIINAVSFYISALSECFLDIPKTNVKNEEKSVKLFFSDFSEGIKLSVKNKTILSVTVLAMMLNFALGAFAIGGTFICKSILKVSDFQYGLVGSVEMGGMMLATLFIGYLSRKYSVGKNLYLSLFYTGIVSSLFGIVVFKPFLALFNTSLPPYILLIALCIGLSILIGIANVFVGIYFQSVVPLEYMGRVSTVLGTVSMAASPLSNMVFGVLFDRIPTTSIFILVAILVIIPVLLYKKVLLSVDISSDSSNESIVEAELT